MNEIRILLRHTWREPAEQFCHPEWETGTEWHFYYAMQYSWTSLTYIGSALSSLSSAEASLNLNKVETWFKKASAKERALSL